MDINMSTCNIFPLSECYKEAADRLMEPVTGYLADMEHGKNHFGQTTTQLQFYAWRCGITSAAAPILYLYRHSIELKLKNIIHMATSADVKRDHSLRKLLKQVKSGVVPKIDGWHRGDEQPIDWMQKWRELDAIFENYFSNDESNTLYRYPTNSEYETIDMPLDKVIKISQLKESMDVVFNILNEFSEFIGVYKDAELSLNDDTQIA